MKNDAGLPPSPTVYEIVNGSGDAVVVVAVLGATGVLVVVDAL